MAEQYGIEVKDVFGGLSLESISNTLKELDPFDDAESAEEFQARLDKGMKLVTKAAKEGEEVLIVTHGNTIRHIVNKISPETNVFQEIGNSSVTTIEYLDGQLRLLEFNR